MYFVFIGHIMEYNRKSMSPMIFSHGSYTPQHIHWDVHDISPPMTQGLNLTVIQLMHSPYLTDVLTIIAYILTLAISTSMIWHDSEQQDPLLHIIMVHTQFTAGDHVEINSPYSQYDGVHGIVLKLTPKHVAVALDTDLDVPLNFRAWLMSFPSTSICLTLNPWPMNLTHFPMQTLTSNPSLSSLLILTLNLRLHQIIPLQRTSTVTFCY